MTTTIVPGTAIQKIVDVSIKNAKTFSEKVFFLELWPIDKATEKTIEVKGEGKKLTGAFELIQFKFDKNNNNFIYTSSDVNQKATYAGTASGFSISGFSAGAVVRIGKTNSTSDVIEQYKGPAESVEVKVELISKPEERLWTSVAWNNGRPRTITGDGADPDDPRFAVRQLDPDGYLKILGDGTAEIGGKGRFYVFKKDAQAALSRQNEYLWSPSVEVSFDIKVDSIQSSDKRFINLGGPTNHFTEVLDNSNGRNYSVVGRYDRAGVGFKKETLHGVYDEYFKMDQKLETKTWYNIRYKQTPIESDKKIRLEGWLDGTKIGEYIDDGTMTQDTKDTDLVVERGDKDALYYPIKNGKMVWTAGAYSGLYIRLTGTVKTFIKNLSVKEV
ncbi:MAG TPA: hypothetical protein VIX38_03525 [Nitrososphaeraceae archaeon]